MAELKSCPFCGSKAKLFVDDADVDDISYQVRCTRCFCETYYEDSEEIVVNAWNERVSDG